MADRYGVGEWYGHVVATAPAATLNALANDSKKPLKQVDRPCPFRETVEPGAKCNKKGGVCSLQIHRQDDAGGVSAVGSFITTCPSRFWQNADIFRWIGQEVIGTPIPTIIKEVDFLESVVIPDAPAAAPAVAMAPAAASVAEEGADAEAELEDEADEEAEPEVKAAEKERDAVGRIDTVLVHPDKPSEWLALELQAVYFSGAGMPSHLKQYETATGLVFPDKNRRPDFRSSGPKRLMPQLQTKVPTLRRWGRKMAVVVDLPFFKSLGPIISVPHLSNSDIAWYVVDYHPTTGAMTLHSRVYTTLEISVEALTAGIPKSREAFEEKLGSLQTATTRAAKKKIIRLT